MSIFVLMAGGTGGHLFPAMALAQELRRRGHIVDLMTDHRVAGYGEQFPARHIHIVPSATPSVRSPLKFLRAGFIIAWGVAIALRQLWAIKPDAVVGFGGYPVFPPFLAARLAGIGGILHEQNAVMGRANRALGRFAARIALSFPVTRFAGAFGTKIVVTGNPVRDRVLKLAGRPYPTLEPGGPIELLVFGGSQGARVFAELVPQAIAQLPAELRSRLRVTQQCRPEDLDRVAEAYRRAKVNVELAAFFTDLPNRMEASHLVICRSGASSVAELTVLGRPAIMIPLPGSIDADQMANGLVIEKAKGGWVMAQDTVSPLSLATRLNSLFGDPGQLQQAASAARSCGLKDAALELANLAEGLTERRETNS